MAQIIAAIVGAVVDTVFSVWSKAAGDTEVQYEKDIVSDKERLQEGRGGMSDWQKQQATQGLKSNLSAWQAEQLAKNQRGANAGAGDSGMLAQEQGNVTKATAANLRGGLSDIRGQDLALAEQQLQDLHRREEFAIAAENQRKTGTTMDVSGTLDSSGLEAGSSTRDQTGGNISSATEDISGGSGGSGGSTVGATESSGAGAGATEGVGAAGGAASGAGTASASKTAAPSSGSAGSPLAGASATLSSTSGSYGSDPNNRSAVPSSKTQAPKASWQQ